MNICINKNIFIKPNYLSQNTNNIVQSYLHDNYLHTLSSDGYIQEIKSISEVNIGEILNDGSIMYNVNFNAIVYKLEENQVTDAIIRNITSFGIYCTDKNDPKNISSLFVPINNIKNIDEFKENQVISLLIKAIRIKKNEYLCVCLLNTHESSQQV